jgi:purine-binding chemotaxis protein CheW
MQTSTDGLDRTQYLTFSLAGEEYAIGALRVREIIEYDTLTAVPTAPDYLRGVINLRGSVVPVLDLAVKFGLPATSITRRTCIVIVETELEGENAVVGILADAVSQVIGLGAGDIEAPPAFGTRARGGYLLGLGKTGKKFLLLLNVDRILSPADLVPAAPGESCAADPEAAAR